MAHADEIEAKRFPPVGLGVAEYAVKKEHAGEAETEESVVQEDRRIVSQPRDSSTPRVRRTVAIHTMKDRQDQRSEGLYLQLPTDDAPAKR